MNQCVACDKHREHYDDEHLFDSIRTWLWEDAPYLLVTFPAMKYTAKRQSNGETMLCRSCLIDHVREWLHDADAPVGVKQRFNTYFGYEPIRPKMPKHRRKTKRETNSVTSSTP